MAETSKTVTEALRLLTLVADAPGSIADLTRRMGLSRTAVQRLLTSLHEASFVFRLPDGRYAIGMAAVELAGRTAVPLATLSLPHMERLARSTNETVVLTMRQGDEAVSIAQVPAPDRVVRAEYPPGFRHPLGVAAGGKAILAALDEADWDRLLVPTRKAAEQRRDFEDFREQGYAVSVNELQQGAAGLAAPIAGPSGPPIASVGVIVPADRFAADAELADAVVATAEAIAKALLI